MTVPDIVDASPARVAEHDRHGWLALFSERAVLEDPVGAAQYRGAQLEGFYATFIAPNRIRFEVERDAAIDGEVWRDVTIHTRLSTGVELSVPAFVCYRVSADGELDRLAAYWEVRRMVWQVARGGVRGLWSVAVLSARMLRHLGARGVWGFVRALTRGVFDRGHRVVERWTDAVNRGERDLAVRMLAADVEIDWGGERLEPGALLEAVGAMRVDKPISAGRHTACRLRTGERAGVALFGFASDGRIERLRFVPVLSNAPGGALHRG